jgi:predicted HAD superfamily Cof-like phosphohydrolase
MTTLNMTKKCHEVFGLPIKETPNIHDEALNELRIGLIAEELGELIEALVEKNPAKVLDALADLQVVLDGAFISLGFYPLKIAAVAEAHRANMSKLGGDGKPILRADGKYLKGPNYVPPDFERLLNANS